MKGVLDEDSVRTTGLYQRCFNSPLLFSIYAKETQVQDSIYNSEEWCKFSSQLINIEKTVGHI